METLKRLKDRFERKSVKKSKDKEKRKSGSYEVEQAESDMPPEMPGVRGASAVVKTKPEVAPKPEKNKPEKKVKPEVLPKPKKGLLGWVSQESAIKEKKKDEDNEEKVKNDEEKSKTDEKTKKKRIHETAEKGEFDRRKSSLAEEKINELHETFKLFDKNRDGMITKEELGAMLHALGQRPSVGEVQALIRTVDSDSSGTIDFDEFVKMFSTKVTIDPEQELQEVFQFFDQNGDGFICPEELYNMLHKLGESITMAEATKMIHEADLDKDGKVDYKEFKAILNAR